jgi:hypothetical protein
MAVDVSGSVERLLAEGVLVETEAGLQPAAAFSRRRDEQRTALADPDALESARQEYAEFVAEDTELGPAVLADARAVTETTPDIDDEVGLQFALLLDRLDGDDPVSGVPEGFLPITGDEIDRYLAEFPESVLYFWREDCAPCEDVRADLEGLLEAGDIPDHVGRAAVYGPGSAQLIHERYDVAVAPTILFAANGTIDSRYVGPKTREAYRAEIEIISES